MNRYNLETITRIYNRLEDKKSKEVFQAKFEFIISHDENRLFDWAINEGEKIYCPELDMYEKELYSIWSGTGGDES